MSPLRGVLPLVALIACDKGSIQLDETADSPEPTDSALPATDLCDDRAGTILCEAGEAITCDEAGDVLSSTECIEPAEVCVEELGCGLCLELDAPGIEDALEAAHPLSLHAIPEAGAAGYFGGLPIDLHSDLPAGEVQLSTTGPLLLYDAEGVELGANATLDLAKHRRVVVAGSAPGEGQLELSTEACGASPMRSFSVVEPQAWAGRRLEAYPWIERIRSFHEGEPITLALPGEGYPDRLGQELQAWVVLHREAESYLEDPALEHLGEEPLTLTLEAGLEEQRFDLLEIGPDGGRGTGYDIILDADASGSLSPGDLFTDLSRPDVYALGDLGAPGPYTPQSTQYSGGRWLGQRSYYPEEIGSLDPRPLVVISHGNGHDYTWYDYLGEHLASWGYVVMSHENETGPGIRTASSTTLDNTEYFLESLDLIDGGVLLDKVDSGRIAWIGHSRGGEGVVYAYDRLLEGDHDVGMYTAEDIVLVASIAPTVFEPLTDTDPHDVPYFLIAGSADGDVHGAPDCTQCQYMRIAQRGHGRVSTMLLQGVGHNEFNCCGFNDATGPDLIGRTATQELARVYFLALLEHFVEGREATRELFTRMYDTSAPPQLDPEIIASLTWTEPVGGAQLTVDDFELNSSEDTSSSGGEVLLEVEDQAEGQLADGDEGLGHEEDDPMNGATQALLTDPSARGLVFSWSEPGRSLRFLAPTSWDLSSLHSLQLRAAQGTRHPETVELAGPVSFQVSLVDASGAASALPTALYGTVRAPYLRGGDGPGLGWSNEFATIRLRLADFRQGERELDLGQITELRLDFGLDGDPEQGRLMIDDLVFTVD